MVSRDLPSIPSESLQSPAPQNLVAGIDFGSQLAGTTVVCREIHGALSFFRSVKGSSADLFLEKHFGEFPACLVGLDAPLSLPGVYRGLPGHTDYHYRAADRQLGAMSPMFLGGLTARAMKLKAILSTLGHTVIEVYPAGLLEELKIISSYKKKPGEYAQVIAAVERITLIAAPEQVQSSHDVDAFLAFVSAQRAFNGKAMAFGDTREGTITV